MVLNLGIFYIAPHCTEGKASRSIFLTTNKNVYLKIFFPMVYT